MFVIFLLWISFVFGGAFMGITAILHMNEQGFNVGVFLNAVVFFGIALYGLPKLVRLVVRRG